MRDDLWLRPSLSAYALALLLSTNGYAPDIPVLQGGVERDFCESDWSILDRLIRERALSTQRRVTSVRGQALDNGANMVSPDVAVGWLDEIGALQVSLAFLWLSVLGII